MQKLPPMTNHLLAALPEPEWRRWLPQLEWVSLPLGHVLYESGITFEHVYFPADILGGVRAAQDAPESVVGRGLQRRSIPGRGGRVLSAHDQPGGQGNCNVRQLAAGGGKCTTAQAGADRRAALKSKSCSVKYRSLTALAEHAAACERRRGRPFTVRCAVDGVVVARCWTTTLAVALLIGIMAYFA